MGRPRERQKRGGRGRKIGGRKNGHPEFWKRGCAPTDEYSKLLNHVKYTDLNMLYTRGWPLAVAAVVFLNEYFGACTE